jgi:hypothetical protein
MPRPAKRPQTDAALNVNGFSAETRKIRASLAAKS